jgi:hypothetical protein
MDVQTLVDLVRILKESFTPQELLALVESDGAATTAEEAVRRTVMNYVRAARSLQIDGDLLENLRVPTADEQKDLSQYITHRVQRTIQASKRQEKSEKELEALEWIGAVMSNSETLYSPPPPEQEMERLAEGVGSLNQMVVHRNSRARRGRFNVLRVYEYRDKSC